MNKKYLAILALVIASIIWGATGPIMKLTLLSVPLFSLAFIRFFSAALILYPFVRKNLSIKAGDVPLLTLSAFLGITFHISFFFLGLTLTSALNAGIIIASLPIFTLLFAALFLKEKITKKLVVGSIIGISGIGIIIGQDFTMHGFILSPIGDLIILLANFSFIGYEIFSKKLFKRYKPSTITFYAFLIGSIGFLPAFIYEITSNPQLIQNIPAAAIYGVLYGILFSSLSAYSLWQWGLSKIDTAKAGFFFYLDPIASTVAAVFILSEKITTPFILGAILIFLGLFFAEGRLPYYSLIKHVLANRLKK